MKNRLFSFAIILFRLFETRIPSRPIYIFTWTLTYFLPFAEVSAQLTKLPWNERKDLNILLPKSIKIHDYHGLLDDGKPLKAVFALIDLRDNNLKLRVVGSNTHRETTKQSYEKNNGILAINGGYFSNNSSTSLIISDGELIATGPNQGISRGAFGLVDRKPQIVWPHETNEGISIYDHPTSPQDPRSKKGLPWLANQAVGGGPVLIKNGKISYYGKEEGFGGSHMARHPRTAIGYINENFLVMLVVDGRQEGSAGVTLDELAEIMLDIGCQEAVNLDGGGSSAMIAADETVNIPTDIPNGDRNSLRRNASAIVISENIPTNKKETIILDTDSPHYSEMGLWKDSNHSNHYGDSPSRISSADYSYNRAVYSFEGVKPQTYQLATWWTVNTTLNTDSTLVILHHAYTVDSMYINQASIEKAGKWNVLGDYELGPGDYLELAGAGKSGNVAVDAIRLVAIGKSPPLPERGDLRIAVISDLNSGLGAANYEWQVDSIIQRIPRIWKPDLVICGGDMVAGMGVSDTSTLKKMWEGFNHHIAQPFREAHIPFAFTLGNHDGPRSYPIERKATQDYWHNPKNSTGLKFIDNSHFPDYYSFMIDEVFVASWDAASPTITSENILWLEEQFQLEEAKNAKLRFVMGHMPLYSVAQERDSKGNVLENPESLRELLLKYDVHTYISGHQHAYYPGKRGQLELLNTGAAGSGPRGWLDMDMSPVNTITIMDIFHDRDTIVYTTYDISERDAASMKIMDHKVLPTAFFGVNGHMIHRDKPLQSAVEGVFYDPSTLYKWGEVSIHIQGDDLMITGQLDRKKPKLALYRGRNAEAGELLQDLNPTYKKDGSFNASINGSENLQEWMSVGALYILADEQIKAQLYPLDNKAPAATSITSHNNRNVYAVRDIKALLQVKWDKAVDPDGDFVTYQYQLASDRNFKNLVLNAHTGRKADYKMTEKEWFELLEEAKEGERVEFYHRVTASDGNKWTYSPEAKLMLMKSFEPLDDYIEVPAPEFTFAGKIEGATGAGYGAVWDGDEKLWLADYGGKLTIKNQDGSDASFSPLAAVSINGEDYSFNPINGIGVDLDGNILIGRNRHLIKINALTGDGMAVWQVPDGNRAITSPRVNDKGEIYTMSLFAEDDNYVLKQSDKDPSTFELLRTISLPERVLARTFDMAADGMTLYFPSPGSPFIQKFTSNDGITYSKAEEITSLAAGSNAIRVTEMGQLYLAVRASGVRPSTFHFRDDDKKVMWTMELPEVNGAEARGIGVSPDGKTLIFCSYDKGGGFYKYDLK